MKKFILLSTQRSGTTFLSEYMMTHPEIKMGRELFKNSSSGRNTDNNPYCKSNKSINNFLTEYYSTSIPVCGFKLMWNHFKQYPELQIYIEENKIDIIYMERTNLLKTVVSRLSARQQQHYHSNHSIKFKPIELAITDIYQELDILSKTLLEIHTFLDKKSYLHINYEKFSTNHDKTLNKMQQYFDLTPYKLKCPLQKINSDTLVDVIKNYNEVYSFLISTKYASCL